MRIFVVLACLGVLGAGPPVLAQVLTGYGSSHSGQKRTPDGALAPGHLNESEKISDYSGVYSNLSPSKEPVDLQADKLVHNEKTQVITASGNVMLEQAERILRADEISYDLKTDTVYARGNVVLNEVNGDVHFSDEVQLQDKLKDGFVKGLKSFLNDGSRFTAAEGKRENGTKTTMYDAAYTPCEPCKDNPDKAPVWQIRASEVSHNEEDSSISYKNARFEIFGIPIAYTPFFSHPDGSIKRKSGLLSPSAGYKSELGVFVETSYYWNIAPDKDATIGMMVMTEEAPLVFGQWRQRWDEAVVNLNGGITYSERTASSGRKDDEVRGHVIGDGLWNLNDKWRSGLKIEWTSDDQYMRQYDFIDEDVLESEIYVERFSGRNYAVGRLLSFQDIRVRDNQVDQPDVLPEVIASFKGEPNSVPVLKGRWSLDASLLGLRREGDDQDMNRASVEAGWNRKLVSDYGLMTTFDTILRGDFYSVRDRDVATPGSGRSRSSTGTRLFPNLHIQSSYPMARQFEKMQATIEPVLALTIAQNIDVNSDIPNEDSQDVQIDASNLFEPNRFPGLDRIEDKSRITYGVRTGLYGYDGSHGDVFLGQSHRLDDDDTPFPVGSGLDEQESDIVGQISGQYKNKYSLNYRFQLENNDFSSQRHEVDAYANWNRFSLSGRYLFAKALAGTDIDQNREQLQADAAYYVAEDWRLRSGGTQDLGGEDPGLRKAYLGVDYFGQCLSWSLIGERNLTSDSSGDSDTEVLFRIGLKNLGEFQASGLRAPGTR